MTEHQRRCAPLRIRGNTKCIITPTVSGATARVVSKFKPKVDIIGVSPNESALRRMQIYWGVRPLKSIGFDSEEDIVDGALSLITAKQLVDPGDVVVVTSGVPSPGFVQSGECVTNTMRVAIIQ